MEEVITLHPKVGIICIHGALGYCLARATKDRVGDVSTDGPLWASVHGVRISCESYRLRQVPRCSAVFVLLK